MSQKANRLLLLGFTAAVVLLLLVSLGKASHYYSTNAALAAKSQEILRIRSNMLALNASILGIELSALRLTSSVTTLTHEVAALENQSALLRMELAVAERAGRVNVLTYCSDKTITLAASSTQEVTSPVPGHSGTIVFLTPGGRPI